jgi:3-oxosteroid 1-dehydrogenase
METDFISVGSGIGGLSGAIAAHDGGLEALILEKASVIGGATGYSYGQVWIPANPVMLAAGLADTLEEGKRYLDFISGGYADPALQRRYLDVGPEAVEYFAEKAGVGWKIIADYSDYYYPSGPGTAAQGRFLDVEPISGSDLGEWQARSRLSPHAPSGITHDEMFAWGGASSMADWDFEVLGARVAADRRTMGPGLAAYFIRAAVIARSIPAKVDSPVRRLVVEDGAVVGVEADVEGVPTRIRARRGVLLAMGGYDHDEDRARWLEQRPAYKSALPPGADGDHLVIAGEIGADVATVPPVNACAILGYHMPGEEHLGEENAGRPLWRPSFEAGLPHMIAVNSAGRRFGDESFYRDYQPRMTAWDGLEQRFENLPAFLVFDQSYRDRYPIASIPPGVPLPDGFAEQAGDLRTLAGKLGIDPDGLERTVARFNADAATGTDTEFGRGSWPWANFMFGDLNCKPNPNLGPLVKPPFYGFEAHSVGVGVNAAGLRIDPDARVRHVRGHPITGLYAAGGTAAYLDIGSGYQSGIANGRGMIWGYLAGRHAATGGTPPTPG